MKYYRISQDVDTTAVGYFKEQNVLPVEIKLDNFVRVDRDSCDTLLVVRIVSWVAWR